MQFWDLVEIDRKVFSALGQNRAEVCLPSSALILPQPREKRFDGLVFVRAHAPAGRVVDRRDAQVVTSVSWDGTFEKNENQTRQNTDKPFKK